MKPISVDTVFPHEAQDIELIEPLHNIVADKAENVEAIAAEAEKLAAADMPALALAWVQFVKMDCLLASASYSDAVNDCVAVLRILIEAEDVDRKSVDFLALVAGVLYDLAYIHNKLGDNKRAEKELVKAQKIFDKLAKKDNPRFAAIMVEALNASTDIFQSKLKLMNLLAHYQVAADLYQNKVASGVGNAVDRLVDSLKNQGDIHLKIGNYRDAVKYYTKAMRYHKRVSGTMGLRELRISLNMAKALLNIINRHTAGEQLLESLIPLAERLDAKEEIEEIKNLHNNFNKTFDIMSFFKKLF